MDTHPHAIPRAIFWTIVTATWFGAVYFLQRLIRRWRQLSLDQTEAILALAVLTAAIAIAVLL